MRRLPALLVLLALAACSAPAAATPPPAPAVDKALVVVDGGCWLDDPGVPGGRFAIDCWSPGAYGQPNYTGPRQ